MTHQTGWPSLSDGTAHAGQNRPANMRIWLYLRCFFNSKSNVMGLASSDVILRNCKKSRRSRLAHLSRVTGLHRYPCQECMLNSFETYYMGFCYARPQNISDFHEVLMFPKLSEIFGKIRNRLVNFIILHRIWGQKYHNTDQIISKMTSMDRNHM